MIPFETKRLTVRRWEERDRPAFHRLNADDEVMRFFPFRRDRLQSDALMDRLNARIDAEGIGFFALEEKGSGEAIGFTGLSNVEETLPFAPAVEIGWRLLPERWGSGYVQEAASACLDRAFGALRLGEVVSFCVVGNSRSERVMQRLGFTEAADSPFDHPGVDPAAHPSLVPHKLYRLARAAWPAGGAAAIS